MIFRVVLVLIASVMLMGHMECESDRWKKENHLWLPLPIDGPFGIITITHKPNGVMLNGKIKSETYYILKVSVHERNIKAEVLLEEYEEPKRSKESIIKDFLRKQLNRGMDVSLYDEHENRLLLFDVSDYRYSYHRDLTQEEEGGWKLTWKGIIPEEKLVYEAFRDITSVRANFR